jgi:hypothetical protein
MYTNSNHDEDYHVHQVKGGKRPKKKTKLQL